MVFSTETVETHWTLIFLFSNSNYDNMNYQMEIEKLLLVVCEY